MGSRLGGVSALLGFGMLLHATYAVSTYRDFLKLTQEEFTALPLNVVLEVACGVVICCLGATLLSGSLKPIYLEQGPQSVDCGSVRPDFMCFSTRAKAIPYGVSPPGPGRGKKHL